MLLTELLPNVQTLSHTDKLLLLNVLVTELLQDEGLSETDISKITSISSPGFDEPTTQELTQIAQSGNAFKFLENEPDLYTLADGEPIA
jgi:hypothetical protein